MTEKKINKIVLAYSGGLDTSVMLHWLRARYGCEVVCYCADVGQGEELAGLEEKAKATGSGLGPGYEPYGDRHFLRDHAAEVGGQRRIVIARNPDPVAPRLQSRDGVPVGIR